MSTSRSPRIALITCALVMLALLWAIVVWAPWKRVPLVSAKGLPAEKAAPSGAAQPPISKSDINSAWEDIKALNPSGDFATMSRQRIFDAALAATHAYLFGGNAAQVPLDKALFQRRLDLGNDFLRAFFRDPVDLKATQWTSASFGDELFNNRFALLKSNNEAFRAAELYFLSKWAVSIDGSDLGRYFIHRANEVPSNTADLLAYWGLSEGISDIGPGPTHNFPVLEEMAGYSKSSNPVYRLLALEAIRVALPKESQSSVQPQESLAIAEARLAAYRQYLDEKEPILVDKLIYALKHSSAPDAAEVLKTVRTK